MSRKLLIVMRPAAGGMWQHLLTLVDGLGPEYDPVVCCQNDPEQLRVLRSKSIPTRIIPIPPNIRPIADVRSALALRRIIVKEKPALIHSHGFHAGLVTALACKFIRKPPHVCTLHGMAVRPWSGKVLTAFYDLLQRSLARNVSELIAVSEGVRDALPDGGAPAKVAVIPNGVSARQVATTIAAPTARDSLKLKESDTVVGYVGRLAPEKGVEDFLRMAAVLRDSSSQARFVIVGDGPQREELQSLAAELELNGRVRFVGEHFPGADFMQVFDVTVVPSLSEGQSLVAMESMMLGVPVVGTRVGGLREVVREEAGRLVAPGEPQELARAVEEILLSGRGAGMGEKGRRIVEREFTADRMVARTKNIYEEALAAAEATS